MADRVRLSLYCPTCLPGYHLPFFTGVVSGVFADHGLVVDILDPPPPPGTTNTVRVASGGAEFGLTGITYFLFAQEEAGNHLPARFISVIHQRSPLGAIVADDSGIKEPADLAGCRMGRGELTGWLADEAGKALADRGLGPPAYVDLGHGEAPYALGRGEIDVVATMVDAMVGVGAKGGLVVRAVPLGHPIYASGLIAGDDVPTELVERMRSAVAAAFALQQRHPASAVSEFCQRFPDVEPHLARLSWELLQPYTAAAGGAGTMEPAAWTVTTDWLRGVHKLPWLPPERVYRPDMATPTPVVAATRPSGLDDQAVPDPPDRLH